MIEVTNAFLGCREALRRFVGRLLRRPHDVEDIVQEAFVRTYAAELSGHIDAPKAYLFKTAKNLALKELNRSATRLAAWMEDSEYSEVLVDELSAEHRVQASEHFLVFCQAVRELPRQCRRVFILRKVYDLSYQDIADRLDLSVSTVEKHMLNGISKCSAYMRARGYDTGADRVSRPRRADG